ncbi:hypothetical protein DFQ09_103268 [Winogradskyella pacifica]|uniref:Uncharacterized protein n=1 Tax=Winogradskyella pacifica TaxID=664642 RepID=A0A3D9N4H8_9FLAO|nr:hypothetical protein DFQ09_103268 [Winogradskyella pacifica]
MELKRYQKRAVILIIKHSELKCNTKNCLLVISEIYVIVKAMNNNTIMALFIVYEFSFYF